MEKQCDICGHETFGDGPPFFTKCEDGVMEYDDREHPPGDDDSMWEEAGVK